MAAVQGDEQNTGYVTGIVDLTRLAETRRRLAAGELALALAALRGDADGWLAVAPPSVVDKTLLPPSGDRRDYLTFGPYWWPDPARPDGLPYLRRDGEVNPQCLVGTDRVAIERMAELVETCAQAWHLTGHAPYATHAARAIRRWFLDPASAMRPHLRYAQGIPGRCDGRGIGLIETRRLCQVLNALELLEGSDALGDGERQAVLAWFAEYRDWLRDSDHGRAEVREHNNHGTWYDVQLAHFALATGDRALAIQVLTAARDTRLAAQVEPDGSQPHELARTRAFTYCLVNLAGLLALADLGRRVGVDFWHHPTPSDARLPAAIAWLAPWADAATPWPYQQITGIERIRLLPFLRQGLAEGDATLAPWIARLPADEAARERSGLLFP